MKINIVFNIEKGATGGGNQFLRAFSECLKNQGSYAEYPDKAHVILFNSHHCIDRVVSLKKKFPQKVFVHRIDGPMRLYNSLSDKRDYVTNTANEVIADATIFQSNWSRQQNHLLGLRENSFETTIINAPDPTIFNRENKVPFSFDRIIRLIATSWSSNRKKGFEVYKWLDEYLDFKRYEMAFVGNSPIHFKNIRHIPPLASQELAGELKKSDIFVTASQKDPCSNSLIEAMHCGLPALGLADGGHPEIIQSGGELFDDPEQIPGRLHKIVTNYDTYQNAIKLPTIKEVASRYYEFMKHIYDLVQQKKYAPKRLTVKGLLRTQFSLYGWKMYNKMKFLFQ